MISYSLETSFVCNVVCYMAECYKMVQIVPTKHSFHVFTKTTTARFNKSKKSWKLYSAFTKKSGKLEKLNTQKLEQTKILFRLKKTKDLIIGTNCTQQAPDQHFMNQILHKFCRTLFWIETDVWNFKHLELSSSKREKLATQIAQQFNRIATHQPFERWMNAIRQIFFRKTLQSK